jgi:prophage DNA circulation protein
MSSIYERLTAGESADDIARQFTDELNAAQRQIDAEKAAAEAAATASRTRVESATNLLLDTYKFLREYYPHLVDMEVDESTDIQQVAELMCLLLDNAKMSVCDQARDWAFATMVDNLFNF